LAFQDVASVGPGDAQAQVRGIGAAARLGERDRDQPLAGDHALEPWAGDLGARMLGEYLPVQRSKQVDVAHAEVDPRDLLVDHAGGDAAHALSTGWLRKLRRDE